MYMSEWESDPGCLISHSGYLIIKPWRTCFDQEYERTVSHYKYDIGYRCKVL